MLVNSPRVALGLAATTGLFVAGWWTGRAVWPATTRAPAAATSAVPQNAVAPTTGQPTAAEALARFAADNQALPRRELAALLRTASATEIPALLDRVSKLPHRLDRERFRAALLARWVALDPAAARAWAEARPILVDRREALRDVFSAWSQQAPIAVAALITSDNIPGGIETLDDVLSAWLASDPARARAWVVGITNTQLRNLAIQAFVSVLAEDDPTAALDTALSLSTEWGGRISLHAAVRAMVQRDPSRAASILDRITAGELRNWAAVQIVEVMAASDPKLAAEFALTLPAGVGRSQSLTTAVTAMAADPESALKWLEAALPAGGERSAAQLLIVEQVAERTPREALEYLEQIPPESRSTALSSILGHWSAADPVAATAYVRQLPPGADRNQAAERLIMLRFRSDPSGALTELQRDFPDLQSGGFFPSSRATPPAFPLTRPSRCFRACPPTSPVRSF